MNKDIRAYLSKCRDAYFNGRPLIPDEVYDRLVENVNTDEVGSATDSRFKPVSYTHLTLPTKA